MLGWTILLAGMALSLFGAGFGAGRYGFYLGLALVLVGGYVVGKSWKN